MRIRRSSALPNAWAPPASPSSACPETAWTSSPATVPTRASSCGQSRSSTSRLGDVIAAAGKGNALVLVLDHVTDEGNFGAIVRTAEVVGAAGVVIAKARSASVGVGAYKTSAGAVLHIPIAQVSNLARAVEELKAAGFWSCASTEHAKDDVWSAPLAGRVALVMGSEGEGISRLVLEKCDFACKLPQRGRVESLNVAQACTVMCYEWLRREMTGEGARGV